MRAGPPRPARPADDDAYYAQLGREADAFLHGRGRSGGQSLYQEIEGAVAGWVGYGGRLPDPDDPRPLRRRAGPGPDGLTAGAAWDLFHDYVTYHLFAPGDARIYSVFQQGRDLAGFRRWLVRELRRFIGVRMRDDQSVRLRDHLAKGIGGFFARRGLVRCGRRPGAYWSERERTAEEAALILAHVDVECALDLAMREIVEQTVTLAEDRPTRLVSGWGPGERGKMARILAARLSADVPALGRATFIPERLLKARLTRLIESSFPELFTEPLYVPLEEAERDSADEQREVSGVRRAQVTDALGATDAALEIMETLTFQMPPARSGGTSGADVKRVVRLYFDGAYSTREGEAAWASEPAERRGDRPITVADLAECMPGGAQTVAPVQVAARLEALCSAFNEPPAESVPRSHVTVNALRDRCWELWAESCVGLSPVAEALAFHWFVDLLYAEVGRDTPFASLDAAATTLLDKRDAEQAAAAALAALRGKASRPGFARLLPVMTASLEGSGDAATAAALGLERADAARLRLAGREVIEKAWRARPLLPSQQAMAEALLGDALGRHGDEAPPSTEVPG